MRGLLPLLALPALLLGCGGTRTVVTTVTVTRAAAAPVGDQRLYGHVRSVEPVPGGFDVRFDPAWFLSGITANAAAAEDQGLTCKPSACPPVPNDNLVVDESDRTYVYFLPATTRGTVLTRSTTGIDQTTVTAARLARIVDGTSPLKLFEPLESGVWVTVHIDTIRSFAQQYRP